MDKTYDAYIAVGDSMSIDVYPALDLNQPEQTPVGAASLLFRNHSGFYPSFEGRDLHTLIPGIQFLNLAEDGYTTFDLLDKPFARHESEYAKRPVLITVTLGGNDALQLIRMDRSAPSLLTNAVAQIVDRYARVVSVIKTSFQSATVVLTTIYDPSDGTGNLPGVPDFSDLLPFLQFINNKIRGFAETNNWLIADVHQHFSGHGVTAAPSEQYYWTENPIEPSALGASELRALWLETLQKPSAF